MGGQINDVNVYNLIIFSAFIHTPSVLVHCDGKKASLILGKLRNCGFNAGFFILTMK